MIGEGERASLASANGANFPFISDTATYTIDN